MKYDDPVVLLAVTAAIGVAVIVLPVAIGAGVLWKIRTKTRKSGRITSM